MVIAHITDIHITPGLERAHKVDVAANFLRIISDVKSYDDITHIVLTGDLCFQDPMLSIMEWVKSALDNSGLPYYVIPGNHDDSIVMGKVFNMGQSLQGDELYYNTIVEDTNLIFLDSGKGRLSGGQIAWLKTIDSITTQPSIIFMHHIIFGYSRKTR